MESSSQPPRIIVVGAGIIGASLAFHLSRRPVRLTVLDRAEPGSGASSHSFAWINASAGKEPASYHDLNRRSVDMWDRFARSLAADVGLRWGGELRWAATPAEAEELRAAVAVLQQRGHHSRLLNEAECQALEPGLRLDRFVLGALSPNDAQVDPARVIRACLGQVRARGGTVEAHNEVQGFRLAGSPPRVAAVQTDKGELACDLVVLAAGVDATRLADLLGMHLPSSAVPGWWFGPTRSRRCCSGWPC